MRNYPTIAPRKLAPLVGAGDEPDSSGNSGRDAMKESAYRTYSSRTAPEPSDGNAHKHAPLLQGEEGQRQ